MKIAMLAPPWLPVPPAGYGGLEKVVSYLTEGLVKRGHNVTLYAAGDATTTAHLEYIYTHALGNDVPTKLNIHNALNHLYHFFKDTVPKGFDIIHNHAQRSAYYFLDMQSTPFVHTLHGSYTSAQDTMVKLTGGISILSQFAHHLHVSISKHQQLDMPFLTYVATIYNAVDLQEFPYHEDHGKDVVWVGRITPTKGVADMLSVANALHYPVTMGGWIDSADQDYFIQKILPFIQSEQVNFLGELKDPQQKCSLFKKGKLLLYPLQWEEPFGLVMLEAMACGTPVVAYARGSAPELIVDGVTGFLVNPSDADIRGNFIVKKTGIAGLCEAVEKIYALPKNEYIQMSQQAHDHVRKHFTIDQAVQRYEAVYEKVLSRR